MTAYANNLLTFSSKMDNAFITIGFNNWKKGSKNTNLVAYIPNLTPKNKRSKNETDRHF